MLFEKILNEEYENDFLNEMANLSAKRYKMPANIFISAKGNAKHGARIKIQTSYSSRMDSHHLVTMTVPDKRIIGDTGELSKADIRYFERFIDANKDLLLQYWNNGENMFIDDVIENLIFDV